VKVALECLPCIVDDVLSATALLEKNDRKQIQVAHEVAQFLSNTYNIGREPSYYITEVHRILKRVSGIDVPFSEKRHASNILGKKIAERLTLPHGEEERFFFLIRAAVAANHIDYRTAGTGYEAMPDETEAMFSREMEKGLAVDESKKIFESVRSAHSVLYICDNVGEIAIDRLFIREISKYADVVAAVRSGPITSDATLEDARFVGLDETCPLIIAGPDTLGISFDEMSCELEVAMKESDLILTKGQANFYVMEEHRSEISVPIACLFSTKCDYVSSYFGLSGKVNIAILLEK
jgi:uncharacterized protein with ATP-grasp and redox domains